MAVDAKFAIAAEVLGEADAVVRRLEKVAPSIDKASESLATASAALETNLERTRKDTAALIEHAQSGAVKFIVRRANEVNDEKLVAHTAALETAARNAIDAALDPRMTQLLASLNQAIASSLHQPWRSWLTHLATALVAGGLGAILVFVFAK